MQHTSYMHDPAQLASTSQGPVTSLCGNSSRAATESEADRCVLKFYGRRVDITLRGALFTTHWFEAQVASFKHEG